MIADLPNLLVAWGIQLTGAMSPGPGVALILGVATAQGRRPALLTALGIACGAVILALLTVVGLAAVLSQMREVMIAVRWFGAAYLAWLAVGAFRKAATPGTAPTARDVAPTSDLRRVTGGFLLQMSNPKAIFFWLAIAAVGSLGHASAATLAVFVAGAFAISFASHGGWALLLSSGPFRRGYAAARRWIEGTLGVFFALASLKLLTTRT